MHDVNMIIKEYTYNLSRGLNSYCNLKAFNPSLLIQDYDNKCNDISQVFINYNNYKRPILTAEIITDKDVFSAQTIRFLSYY